MAKNKPKRESKFEAKVNALPQNRHELKLYYQRVLTLPPKDIEVFVFRSSAGDYLIDKSRSIFFLMNKESEVEATLDKKWIPKVIGYNVIDINELPIDERNFIVTVASADTTFTAVTPGFIDSGRR